MHMKRFVGVMLLIGLFSTCMAACKPDDVKTRDTEKTDLKPQEKMIAASTKFQNPFKGKEAILGKIGHGAVNVQFDQNKKRLPFEYNGQTFTMDYRIMASGVALNNGLIVFLKGIPQLYQTDQTQDLKCFHTFHLQEENKELPFKITFTPGTGKKGETALCTVVSITNPEFKPDLKETQSYGIFHQSLPVQHLIHFNSDPPKIEIPDTFVHADNIHCETLELTENIVQKIQMGNIQEVNIDTFNKDEKYQIYVNGIAGPLEDIAYQPEDPLDVEVFFAGREGKPWAFSFFLDHEPVVFKESLALTWNSAKGKALHITFTINPSKLSNAETFYMIAAPMEDCPNEDYPPVLSKTLSILLHKVYNK